MPPPYHHLSKEPNWFPWDGLVFSFIFHPVCKKSTCRDADRPLIRVSGWSRFPLEAAMMMSSDPIGFSFFLFSGWTGAWNQTRMEESVETCCVCRILRIPAPSTVSYWLRMQFLMVFYRVFTSGYCRIAKPFLWYFVSGFSAVSYWSRWVESWRSWRNFWRFRPDKKDGTKTSEMPKKTANTRVQ